MLIAAFFFSIIANAILGYFLYVGAKRLLQFDALFQRIFLALESYSTDLVRMTSSDLDNVLTDHPEVISFHMRNMRARLEVQNALEDIAKIVPSRRKKDNSLPRPDVE